MVRRPTLVALTAAAACLLFAGAAQAIIHPNRSIAGAALTKTRHQLREKLGAPLKVVHARNEFGRYTVFHYFRIEITFQGNAGATNVSTTRRRQKTPRGIGVGSTKAALRAAYPGARCRKEGPRFNHCWLGSFRPGKRVTDFRIFHHHVKRVDVGFVID